MHLLLLLMMLQCRIEGDNRIEAEICYKAESELPGNYQ